MINQIVNINWISVTIAAVVYFIIGALWFTTFFKKQYAISLGKENEPNHKLEPIFLIGPAICTFVITFTSALFLYELNINSISETIEFALTIGLGYLVANTINIAINPNIPRPILYSVISGSYHLLGITIASIIIVSMR
jgi:heme/copper-type cytochrome/quinol oxidase subunit 2